MSLNWLRPKILLVNVLTLRMSKPGLTEPQIIIARGRSGKFFKTGILLSFYTACEGKLDACKMCAQWTRRGYFVGLDLAPCMRSRIYFAFTSSIKRKPNSSFEDLAKPAQSHDNLGLLKPRP